MKTILLIIFSTSLFSQNLTTKQIERLKVKKEITYEDLAHENPGCLENSACTEEMGALFGAFTKALESKNNVSNLKRFHSKFGLPLNHFTRDTDEETVFFSSRCRQHNPKEGIKTVEAYRFLKKLENDDKHIFEKAELLNAKNEVEKTFTIPLRDTPYYIKNGKLIIMKEFEDFHYYLAIKSNGSFEPIEPKQSDLKTAFKYSENTQECPINKELRADFIGSYCRKIYNFDKNQVQEIRIDWACP